MAVLCKNPYSNGQGMLYGCGQCMPCRINRRRLWTHRMMLEEKLHAHSSFVTLTYTDQNLPLTLQGLPSLSVAHLQNWLKRLRLAISPLKIRYFGVGEYGDETERPHYHVILFGMPTCERTRTLRHVSGLKRPLWEKCCPVCQVIGKTWKFGDIDAGTVNEASLAYCTGYVTKKMTHAEDIRLNGRYPEFARMSLKPGIGADFIYDVASGILEYDLEVREQDFNSLRHGPKVMPLGRYLTKKLRLQLGRDEKAPDYVLQEIEKELRPLREIAFESSRSFKEVAVEANAQKVLNMESRQKVRKKGKVL